MAGARPLVRGLTLPLAAALVALTALRLAGHGPPSLAELSEMPGLPTVGWFGVLALALMVNGCCLTGLLV